MRNLLKGILFGLLIGAVVGWRMAEDKQRREKEAARQAYLNDPEVIALRKERALERQIDQVFDDMEDDNA
jgi:hypothetical protein